ncbi:MAG TPA: hypothetical protein DIW17_14605 [Clostridiales bacterium]|nr:hypothetical protein [Clostridiales bacterium]
MAYLPFLSFRVRFRKQINYCLLYTKPCGMPTNSTLILPQPVFSGIESAHAAHIKYCQIQGRLQCMDTMNQNIKCNVKTCQYHSDQTNYCTRDSIHVNCCETDAPQTSGYTQCSSFCAYR